MGIFICDKCNSLENSKFVNVDRVESGTHPCLSYYKMVSINHYLCSECNTGTWHGKFMKRQPNIGEALRYIKKKH